MKVTHLLLALFLFPLLTWGGPVRTVYGGSQKSTAQAVAQDIATACPNLGFTAQPTGGSLDNLNSLITEPVVISGGRFAIIQSDVLDVVFSTAPRTRLSIKRIAPLYSDEIVVVANRAAQIRSISDLNGKRVVVGSPKSGGWFTANHIKIAHDLHWFAIDKPLEEALLQVLTGDADAAIVVGGTPVRILDELGPNLTSRIEVVPVTIPGYGSSTLKSSSYPWLTHDVSTATTQSWLVAASDVPERDVNLLMSCLIKHLPQLKTSGHKKWTEVNLRN